MSIVGVYWGGWVPHDPDAAAANFVRLLSLLEAGEIAPPVHGIFELDQFPTALGLIRERRARGKVLLRVGG